MNEKKLFTELNKEKDLVVKIGMILSNSCDFGSINGALLSVKKFDDVAKTVIKYFKLK